MSTAAPVLLGAAAGVGVAHAVLPDHWMPLAIISRTQRYPLWRVVRLSALAGVGHVLLSVVLGAIIIAIGLQFRSTIESAQSAIVGGLLIATGVAFLVLQVRGHDHDHHHHHDDHDDQEHAHEEEAVPSRMALLIPFGAAASPDLTILPVFLAATTASTVTAIGTVVLFGAVTIGTFVVLTSVAALGVLRIQGDWLEHWGNAVTGGVLLVIGALVAFGLL